MLRRTSLIDQSGGRASGGTSATADAEQRGENHRQPQPDHEQSPVQASFVDRRDFQPPEPIRPSFYIQHDTPLRLAHPQDACQPHRVTNDTLPPRCKLWCQDPE